MKSNNEKQIGFIAQEILQVIPEVVEKNEGGKYSMSYGNITALLTKAMQEQQELIENQNRRIVELEVQLKNIMTKLDKK